MKKFIFSLALIVTTMVVLNSCDKYPNGPKFSILTKTARLCNNWELVSILKDGNEVISKVPSKTLSIDKDGTFSMADSQTALGQITTSYIHGDWTLETEKTTLSLLQDGLLTNSFGLQQLTGSFSKFSAILLISLTATPS